MRMPLYKKIEQELIEEIENQNPPPNTPFLTENDAIERFGVSRITIRQAFDLLEQRGYIYRVQGKGTFISIREASPTKTVAFLASCILTNGVESTLLRAIEEYIDGHNYNMIICNTNSEFIRTERYLKRLVQSGIDAIVYVCVISDKEYDKNLEYIDFIRNNNIPFVLVDRYIPSAKEGMFIVTPDNFNAAYQMTEHLISIGHEKIGFCTGQYSSAPEERIGGYRKCLQDYQIQFNPEYVKKVTHEDAYKTVATQYSIMKNRPTAIFAICDDAAYELIDAFSLFNIRVPEDIAVVGFDDFAIRPDRSVNLTTMRVPLWEEGRITASIIVDLLEGREIAPSHIRVPCELVVRDTCGIKLFGRRKLAQTVAHHSYETEGVIQK